MPDYIAKAIASACLIEYERANLLKNGRLRKRHVPYQVPQWCSDVIDAVGNGTLPQLLADLTIQYEIGSHS